jgi:rhodanese-related sulfurtransferase
MYADIPQNLIGVDTYRYDDAWELSELSITEKLYGSTSGLPNFLPSKLRTDNMNGCPTNGLKNSARSTMYVTPESSPELGDPPFTETTCTLQNGTTLLDLRTSSSYARSHLPGAANVPLSSLMETSPSPFSDSNTLELQWRELESLCTPETLQLLEGKTVVFIDYDGDTARVATSVFRARGVEAWSLRGGVRGLATETEIETEMQMETETASLDDLNGKGPRASVGLGIGNVGCNFLSLQ